MNESQIQTYLEGLKNEDPIIRYWAVLYFEKLGDKVAVPALIQALGDEDEAVRGAVAKALGAIGPDAAAAVSALKGALEDSDVWVCRCAAYALEKIAGTG